MSDPSSFLTFCLFPLYALPLIYRVAAHPTGLSKASTKERIDELFDTEEKTREALPEEEMPVKLIQLWPDPEIEDATHIPTDVDLIAIHGLGATPFRLGLMGISSGCGTFCRRISLESAS